MNRLTKIISITAIALATTVVVAQSASDNPVIRARQDVMKQIGGAARVLGGMARGQRDFDADKAGDAAASLLEAAKMIVPAFQENVTDSDSKAASSIWEDFDGFSAKAMELETAAMALQGVSSLNELRAGMGAAGATCGACHKMYRN